MDLHQAAWTRYQSFCAWRLARVYHTLIIKVPYLANQATAADSGSHTRMRCICSEGMQQPAKIPTITFYGN